MSTPNESSSDKKLLATAKRAWLRGYGVDSTTPIQLALFAPVKEDRRSMPNDIARSSLFVAKHKATPRQHLKRQKMFHLHEAITILYTGEELRADDDELIWMEILNRCQSSPLGEYFDFALIDIIKALGWSRNGTYYDKVRQSISRLKSNEVYFSNAKAFGISGSFSMISSYESLNDANGQPTHYRMILNPEIIMLFVNNNFSSHRWELYRKLPPIARRLMDYIQSHKTPLPLSVENFRDLCGSDSKNLRSWKQASKKAIKELSALGVISFGEIINNQIVVSRS